MGVSSTYFGSYDPAFMLMIVLLSCSLLALSLTRERHPPVNRYKAEQEVGAESIAVAPE